MTLSIFLVWGAHAPSRVRSEPDWRLHARRMHSPNQIAR